ncbi:CPBP family intramembrane metalloprotease, partial [Nonomuraea sp. K274]
MAVDTPDETSTGRTWPKAPEWPEVLAGGAVYVVSLVLVAVLLPLVENAAAAGVVGLVVSGAMGLIAFAVAVLIRIRGLAAFGIRRAKPRHFAFAVAVLIRIRGLAAFGIRRAKPRHFVVAAVLGFAAYLLGTIVAVIHMHVSGDTQNVQTSYQAAAAAGWCSLVLALVAGAIITPLGEEAFFRGVLANALFARYHAWLAVVASAAVFAVAHGINPVLPVAFVVGVLAALLFRWSGSIWPGVVLHGVNNATA